ALRLKACITSASEMLDNAYLQMLHYGKDNAEIVICVLNALYKTGKCTQVPEHKEAVIRLLRRLQRKFTESLQNEDDRNDAQKRYEEIIENLEKAEMP